MGNVCAELLSIMNIILQTVRSDPSYMGGVLTIASIDHKQLPPIVGTPALISGSVLVSFNFLRLLHSVRELIDITRKDRVCQRDLVHFRNLILLFCKHVRNWISNSIPQEAVRVLGKHKGMAVAEKDIL